MTVYIDDMFKYPMGRFRNMRMSHMICDDINEIELHAMAIKIGMARKWFQGDHYDVCFSKRNLAIAYGAQPITMRELSKMAMEKRRKKVAVLNNLEKALMETFANENKTTQTN